MNREKNLVKNLFILFLGNVLPKMSSIITLPIITAFLTTKEYGTYDLVLTMASLVLPAATLQMQAAAFRFLIMVKEDKKKLNCYITNIVAFIVPVCLVVLTSIYFILSTFDVNIKLLIMLYFFFDTFLNTLRQIARGLGKNGIYSTSVMIQVLVEMLGIFISLPLLHTGLKGFMYALIIAHIIPGLYVILKLKIYTYLDIHLLSIDVIRKLLTYSWPLVPNALSSWVMRVSDRLIITFFLGVEANAVYAVANKLPNIFSLVQSSFTQAWQENASLSVNDSDAEIYFGEMFNHVMNILTGIMALLIGFTPIIFKLLIRGDYGGAYNQMPILYLGVLFGSISSYLGGIYVAHMKSKSLGITTMAAAVCSVIINLLFIRSLGIYAASLATLVSYLFLTIYRMINVQKVQKIKFSYPKVVGKILLLCFLSAICFMRNQYLNIFNMIFSLLLAFILNRGMIFNIYKFIVKKIHTTHKIN